MNARLTVALFCVGLEAADLMGAEPPASSGAAARLVGFAHLPGGRPRAGAGAEPVRPTGAFVADDPARAVRLPLPTQIVSGISGVVALGDGRYLALSDNGFGARANSADYDLAVHEIRIRFRDAASRAAAEPSIQQSADRATEPSIEVLDTIPLRDPERRAGFPIVHETDPRRTLTGGDFDPESIQRAPDGSLWIGDEFGPFLLHFTADGVLIDAPIGVPVEGRDGPMLASPDHPAARAALTERTLQTEPVAPAASAPPAAPKIHGIGASAGFEALALSTDGTRLLAILEKPLAEGERVCLAFEFNIRLRRFTGTVHELPLGTGAKSLTDAQYYGSRRIVAIERDDTQATTAGWKRVVMHRLEVAGGTATRSEVCDLLAIADPDGIASSEAEVAGDVGRGGGSFALPFLTIESLWIEDDRHLVVGVDDNYPLTCGRHAGTHAPDETEFVRLELALPLANPRLRVATFNASLNRSEPGALSIALARGDDPQIAKVADILRRVRPDIVLLNEFDRDPDDAHARAMLDDFKTRYLAVARADSAPIDYPFTLLPTTNTGVASGFDLNRDGRIAELAHIAEGDSTARGYGEDALGFGAFPGQYGMALLSRLPIDVAKTRTFRRFLWRDVPDATLPDDPATEKPGDWYSDAALAVLPFSSKNHVDAVVCVGDRDLHLLLSHPTPPAFDGPEDRNGLRNAMEIRFWLDYLRPDQNRWIRDDAGLEGGLAEGRSFVLLGDLNSDAFDGDSRHSEIRKLLSHERVVDPLPRSTGALESAHAERANSTARVGDSALHTADFPAGRPGDLRVDYALPSRDLEVFDRGVHWPPSRDPHAGATDASDHRLVFVDLLFEGP